MVPGWDVHPEMVSHTRVIDVATGRPLAEVSPATMENWYPATRKSVDELAAYVAYALRILRNCDLPCEGITTPGGFGTASSRLSRPSARRCGTCSAPRSHYFKYVAEGGGRAPAARASQPRHGRRRVVVNVPAAAGDWFGGWDGDSRAAATSTSTPGKTGRMVGSSSAAVPP
jgi:hypothetical protein